MILFPYAEDLQYVDKRIKFTMRFFNNSATTNIQVSFPVDDELARVIDGLFMEPEDSDERELWFDE